MRVTNMMLYNTVLQNLSQNVKRMEKYEDQISSGKRLNHLSDDPVALVRSLTLHSAMEQNDQYTRSIDSAKAWLGTSDTSMGTTTELLGKAKELAVRGANDTLDGQQRSAIAQEVRQLLENVVQVANMNYEGRYIFAGYQTDQAPFSLDANITAVTYAGDAGAIQREIGSGTTMTVNTDGPAAFNPTFNVLIDLYQTLKANDQPGIAATIDNIDSATDTILTARADVGAKINRLDASASQLSEVQGYLLELLSKAEDTDMADAITRLATEETVYKAALGSASKIIQPTLLDFLR
jgi:flagellar hook-associated protein 3 FlgL